jgi:curved DNA-binding protein CbpA
MHPLPRSYYEVLGLPSSATAADIHRAYRKLARRYHPDLNAGSDARLRFDEVSRAYEVLHDPEQRVRYDRSRGSGRAPARPRSPKAPTFSAPRPSRDVPRFLDEERSDLPGPFAGPRWAPPASQAAHRLEVGFGLLPRARLVVRVWRW